MYVLGKIIFYFVVLPFPVRLKTKQRENQPNDQYNFDNSDQDPDYKDGKHYRLLSTHIYGG